MVHLSIILSTAAIALAAPHVPDARPPVDRRSFTNAAVEEYIETVAAEIKDEDLAQMWRNTFPSTLDTTFHWNNFGDTHCPLQYQKAPCPLAFIITGDIPAMWIRDSTNQVLQYAPLIQTDTTGDIARLILGTINMQSYYLMEYVWANAFKSPEWTGYDSGANPWSHGDRVTPAYNESLVWEAKFEVDSWGALFRLAVVYWENANKKQRQDFWDGPFIEALTHIVWKASFMQPGTKDADWEVPYTFTREGSMPTETQFVGGQGNIAKRTGMIRSPFRPSDDATVLPFLVPSNMMFGANLAKIVEMLKEDKQQTLVIRFCEPMAIEVLEGIEKYGIVQDQDCEPGANTCAHYAYEVDGFGGVTEMDDSNVPNLLAAPLYGYTTIDDPIYQRTRARSLSPDTNPWYFRNETTGIEGLGSPHTGLKRVWPMAVATQAMTTRDRAEIENCLTVLLDMQVGTGLMHEGVHVDNPRDYTRQWFAWANSAFAQLIQYLYNDEELKEILRDFVYEPRIQV